MKDKTLVCADCGKEFTFTADDQKFYAEKGFSDPKRCKECRDKRKAEKGKFNKPRFDRN
jgi:DNA-directed RNA polymerase subunit RPC12/RpoP